MSNVNLAKARRLNHDEFYTLYEDIESEVARYKVHLQGKVIYCNCDGQNSAFRQYFLDNFQRYELKGLYCTGINGYYMEYDGYGLVERTDINGDFRSEFCQTLLGKSDICVTNPPFSLFREYVQTVKHFLIIGNKNAVSYKEVFPLMKDQVLKTGYTIPHRFLTPNGEVANLSGLCRWFTTLQVCKPSERQTAHYVLGKYKTFDNYPAINVDRVCEIPNDYTGLMGVPITVFDKFDYRSYELIDLITRYAVIDRAKRVPGHQLTEVDGFPKYARVIIRQKKIHNEN